MSSLPPGTMAGNNDNDNDSDICATSSESNACPTDTRVRHRATAIVSESCSIECDPKTQHCHHHHHTVIAAAETEPGMTTEWVLLTFVTTAAATFTLPSPPPSPPAASPTEAKACPLPRQSSPPPRPHRRHRKGKRSKAEHQEEEARPKSASRSTTATLLAISLTVILLSLLQNRRHHLRTNVHHRALYKQRTLPHSAPSQRRSRRNLFHSSDRTPPESHTISSPSLANMPPRPHSYSHPPSHSDLHLHLNSDGLYPHAPPDASHNETHMVINAATPLPPAAPSSFVPAEMLDYPFDLSHSPPFPLPPIIDSADEDHGAPTPHSKPRPHSFDYHQLHSFRVSPSTFTSGEQAHLPHEWRRIRYLLHSQKTDHQQQEQQWHLRRLFRGSISFDEDSDAKDREEDEEDEAREGMQFHTTLRSLHQRYLSAQPAALGSYSMMQRSADELAWDRHRYYQQLQAREDAQVERIYRDQLRRQRRQEREQLKQEQQQSMSSPSRAHPAPITKSKQLSKQLSRPSSPIHQEIIPDPSKHQETPGESPVFRAGSLNRLSSSTLSKDTSRALGLCRSTTLSAAAKRLSLVKRDRDSTLTAVDATSVPVSVPEVKSGQDEKKSDERLTEEILSRGDPGFEKQDGWSSETTAFFASPASPAAPAAAAAAAIAAPPSSSSSSSSMAFSSPPPPLSPSGGPRRTLLDLTHSLGRSLARRCSSRFSRPSSSASHSRCETPTMSWSQGQSHNSLGGPQGRWSIDHARPSSHMHDFKPLMIGPETVESLLKQQQLQQQQQQQQQQQPQEQAQWSRSKTMRLPGPDSPMRGEPMTKTMTMPLRKGYSPRLSQDLLLLRGGSSDRPLKSSLAIVSSSTTPFWSQASSTAASPPSSSTSSLALDAFDAMDDKHAAGRIRDLQEEEVEEEEEGEEVESEDEYLPPTTLAMSLEFLQSHWGAMSEEELTAAYEELVIQRSATMRSTKKEKKKSPESFGRQLVAVLTRGRRRQSQQQQQQKRRGRAMSWSSSSSSSLTGAQVPALHGNQFNFSSQYKSRPGSMSIETLLTEGRKWMVASAVMSTPAIPCLSPLAIEAQEDLDLMDTSPGLSRSSSSASSSSSMSTPSSSASSSSSSSVSLSIEKTFEDERLNREEGYGGEQVVFDEGIAFYLAPKSQYEFQPLVAR